MLPRRAHETTNPWGSASSVEGLALRGDVLQRSVEMLSLDGSSGPSVKKARRLGANFEGKISLRG